MLRLFAFLGASLMFLFFLTTPAFCHKMRVFAYGEGDRILGEAAFAGGKKALNIKILVEDSASGRTILTTKTDEKGEFQFAIPEDARADRLNLLIIADAGGGHRAEWPLEASDYLLSKPQETAPPQAEPKKNTLAATPQPASEAAAPSINEERLRTLVEDAVSRSSPPYGGILPRTKKGKCPSRISWEESDT